MNFMFSVSYGKDIYDLESQPFVFELMKGSTAAADGADSITITLRRRPGEDVDDLNLGGQGQYVTTDKEWQSFLRDWQSTDYKVIDLQLDVTVTAKKGENNSPLHECMTDTSITRLITIR